MFGRHWEPATGSVVARTVVPTSGDSAPGPPIYDFAVDVRTADGQVFRAEVPTPGIALDFAAPDVGDSVMVEVDPRSRKVRFDKADPQLSIRARKEAGLTQFHEVLAQPAGSVAPDAADPPAAGAVPSNSDVDAVLRGLGGSEARVVRLDASSEEGQAIAQVVRRALGGDETQGAGSSA